MNTVTFSDKKYDVYSNTPLTRADVERLLQNPSVDAKVEIIQKVSGQYTPEHLSAGELAIADQIFQLLVQDSAVKIRAALSESLKHNPHISHDIVMKLAWDEEAVSLPILQVSEVLTEEDLIEIIRNSEEVWRCVAVAARPDVTAPVADALVNFDHKDVTAELLDNGKAEISEKSFEKIIRQVEGDEGLASKMVSRTHLPPSIVEKLSKVVSEKIAKELHDRYHISGKDIEKERKHVLERNVLELIAMERDDVALDSLVTQLHKEGRLTSSLIINALCHGNISFVEQSFAKLGSVPLANARVLMSDKGTLGFRALYNKAGLPPTMSRAVRYLFEAVSNSLREGFIPDSSGFTNQVVRHVLDAVDGQEVDNLSYILALLRQQAQK
jgi:uncharacterized protein (DUF2336 family)